jgi:hypothetical protein
VYFYCPAKEVLTSIEVWAQGKALQMLFIMLSADGAGN